MKQLLAFSLLCSTSALATEYHPDPGMNTPGLAMADPASPNLWTVSGGKANGNGAKAMQMLMWPAPGVKAGHNYLVTFTVSGQTHGVLEASLGSTMTGASTGSNVLASGFTPIADNFPTANGLTSAIPSTPDPLADVGAFRLVCSAGNTSPNDPIVYHNMPGRSHLHTLWGNTEGLNPLGNYSYYRTHGGTTCGEFSSKTTAVSRQAYWMPSMLDGAGNAVLPLFFNQYYKREPTASGPCTNPSNPIYVPGSGGACVALPQGLDYISGYATSTGLGGPADNSNLIWACYGAGTYRNANNEQRSNHLSDFFHGGCAKRGEGGNAPNQGGMIVMLITFANCWDGIHLDTLDHRSHVIYPTRLNGSFFGGCPNDHPYRITVPQSQIHWEIDSNFVAGKWHLSSDEMISGKVSTDPGGSFHTDITISWSPTVQNSWETNCVANGASCSDGSLGDGTAIKDGGIMHSTGGPGNADRLAAGTEPLPKARYYSTALAGIGKPITANGTYSQVITASADGRISLMGIEDSSGLGFDGSVDDMHVVDAGN